jgi:hypothetical protein
MKGKKKLTLALDDSGAVAVVVVIILAALCGFVALAFDIAHIIMVKAELQRTADAAALAGAMGLAPYIGEQPYWQGGENAAKAMINNDANKLDGQPAVIVDDISENSGYWCLKGPNPVPLPQFPKPDSTLLPEPAVVVSLSKDVTLYFAPLVGVSSPKNARASATAILPETYTITGAPPIGVTHDTVFNPDPSNPNEWIIDILTDQDIKPQSNKGLAGWFNFDGGTSVPSVQDMASKEITAGQTPIYFVPGTKATLTDYLSNGMTVTLVYVNDTDLDKGGPVTVQGFAAFKIDPDGLSANSFRGHFVNKAFNPNTKITVPGASPPSPVWGTPKLVSP